jgi:hypothetical protein
LDTSDIPRTQGLDRAEDFRPFVNVTVAVRCRAQPLLCPLQGGSPSLGIITDIQIINVLLASVIIKTAGFIPIGVTRQGPVVLLWLGVWQKPQDISFFHGQVDKLAGGSTLPGLWGNFGFP